MGEHINGLNIVVLEDRHESPINKNVFSLIHCRHFITLRINMINNGVIDVSGSTSN